MSQIILARPVQALDGNGNPVPGARLSFFLTGTSTPAAVFADTAEAIPLSQPIIADGDGVWPAVYRSGVFLRAVATAPSGAVLPGYPIDPVATTSVGSAASQIGFTATPELPANNVQDAVIAAAQSAAAGFAPFGLGILGDAPTLANFDAQDAGAGFRRFLTDTLGERPAGWDNATGTVHFLRETATSGVQIAVRRDANGVAYRRLNAGTWGAWRTLADQADVTTQIGALESATVKLTGNQTIGGEKTFSDPLTINAGVSGSALATVAQARSGTSTTRLMTPSTVEARRNVIAASGGNESDLTTSFDTRLSVNFTATTNLGIFFASLRVVNEGAKNDAFFLFQILDTDTSQVVAERETLETSEAGPIGGGVNMTGHLTAASLEVGKTYTARMRLRKSVSSGPFSPRDMRIDGVQF